MHVNIWQALHVADYFGTVIIHDLKIITEPIQCTFNSSALHQKCKYIPVHVYRLVHFIELKMKINMIYIYNMLKFGPKIKPR